MNRLILLLGMLALALSSLAPAQSDARLVGHLKSIYQSWQAAMVRKDAATWKRLTSMRRQVSVRNRLWSERRRFPDAIFEAQMKPPIINNLKAMSVRINGNTAKATYFGKVDFGVGGAPSENLYVISYVKEGRAWKYDGGEFVKLDALPDVRKQLLSGDKTFLKSKDFLPDGVIKPAPIAIRGPAKYIAKAYVYCPGREVKLLINSVSSHLFQNTKRADVVIGGARDGLNEVQFSIKDIPGGDSKAPMTIRIYLMSLVEGTKPLKPLEYQITDGTKPKGSGTLNFTVTPEIGRKLNGRRF
ncbi:MAG: hypothetical protein ACON4R_07345 [Akkermansiaceae bacterium]